MQTDNRKEKILQKAGFRYSFERSLYFNRDSKKAISHEAVEDHDSDWLRNVIASPNETDTWQFYFNRSIPYATQRELLEFFGEYHAGP